jgi:hypothetical protein
MSARKYWYFVSFTTRCGGFGNAEVCMVRPIVSIADVKAASVVCEGIAGLDEPPPVIAFQLLRTEEAG